MLFAFIVAVVCVLADMLGKYAAQAALGGGSVPVIEGVLHFTYVENRGMAFGMLARHREIFIVLSAILLVTIAVFLFTMRKQGNKFLFFSCGLLLGGGIGNMIDRVRLGYVIDFIDVRLFGKLWTWVFNIADACVCVGVFLLALYLIVDSAKAKKEAQRASLAAQEQDDEDDE